MRLSLYWHRRATSKLTRTPNMTANQSAAMEQAKCTTEKLLPNQIARCGNVWILVVFQMAPFVVGGEAEEKRAGRGTNINHPATTQNNTVKTRNMRHISRTFFSLLIRSFFCVGQIFSRSIAFGCHKYLDSPIIFYAHNMIIWLQNTYLCVYCTV